MKAQDNNSKTSRRPAALKEPDDRSRRRFLKASSIFSLAAAFNPSTIANVLADSKESMLFVVELPMQAPAWTQAT